jgi:hypothetical protein
VKLAFAAAMITGQSCAVPNVSNCRRRQFAAVRFTAAAFCDMTLQNRRRHARDSGRRSISCAR